MTPIVIVRSAQAACQVCENGPVELHFPARGDIPPVGTACLHCRVGLPVVVLPTRPDFKDLRRTS